MGKSTFGPYAFPWSVGNDNSEERFPAFLNHTRPADRTVQHEEVSALDRYEHAKLASTYQGYMGGRSSGNPLRY